MATPMINLAAFLPLVNPHTPGAAGPTMLQALRKSAIEFCERTRCWRHAATLEMTEQGEAIAAPDQAAIHEIERAEFNGVRLTPVQYDDLTLDELADETAGSQPRVITQATFNTVMIAPFEPGTLTVSLLLKPRHGEDMAVGGDGRLSNAYDEVPAFLHGRFAETIAAGAIARVLMNPQQPFTNPEMGMLHGQHFDTGVNRFNSANLRGQHRARPRVRASWF